MILRRLPELLLVEKLLLDELLGLLSMAVVIALCVRLNTCLDGEHRAGT